MSAIKRALLLSLTILLSLTAACSAPDKKVNDIASEDLIISKSTTYRTAEAKLTDLIKQVSTTVEPVYIDRRPVYSENAVMILKSFQVKRGDYVKQGQVLAVLSGTGSETDVRQLELELEYAIASYEETCVKMEDAILQIEQAPAADSYEERIKELKLEKQKAAYELYKLNTENSLSSIRDRLEKARDTLGDKYIYAPYECIVRSIENISEGTVLEPRTRLMIISKADSLLLFSNSSADLFLYNKDISFSVGNGDNKQSSTGRVVSASGLLPDYLGTFVYIKPDDISVIGKNTEAKVTCEYTLLKDVIVIPRTGINSDNGRFFVMLLDGNTTRKRYIIRGPQLTTEIAVFQGIDEGDMIVTSQYTS